MMLRHVWSNVLSLIVSQASPLIPQAIVVEATPSCLGLGIANPSKGPCFSRPSI